MLMPADAASRARAGRRQARRMVANGRRLRLRLRGSPTSPDFWQEDGWTWPDGRSMARRSRSFRRLSRRPRSASEAPKSPRRVPASSSRRTRSTHGSARSSIVPITSTRERYAHRVPSIFGEGARAMSRSINPVRRQVGSARSVGSGTIDSAAGALATHARRDVSALRRRRTARTPPSSPRSPAARAREARPAARPRRPAPPPPRRARRAQASRRRAQEASARSARPLP